MSNGSVRVFWGAQPSERTELEFLAQLTSDLEAAAIRAVILANFNTRAKSRQIDFLVVTETHACQVELKGYHGVIQGQQNGRWSARQADGTFAEIDRDNPYEQALGAKYAISNDMDTFAVQSGASAPAAGRKFYTTFDAVVCIFPTLEVGSNVHSDYKAKTMGYKEFLTFLVGRGNRPPWTDEDITAFIEYLNLRPASALPSEMPLADAKQHLDRYARRFAEFFARDLPGLVALHLDGGEPVLASDVNGLMAPGTGTELLGVSGSGKSHIALHALVDLARDEWLTFRVEATNYREDLKELLSRSAAPFSKLNVDDLIGLARLAERRVAVLIDGINECPARLRKRLSQEVSALRLTVHMALLTTSQTRSDIGWEGDITSLVVPLPKADERAEILALYGAPEIAGLCDAFQTPYELSIAAACKNNMRAPYTRSSLYDAYIRLALQGSASPASARVLLRNIAIEMDDRVTASLSMQEYSLLCEAHLNRTGARIDVLDDIKRCSLAHDSDGRFRFTHESIGRFLVAEALIVGAPTPDALTKELLRPRHSDLMPFVLAMPIGKDRLQVVLSCLENIELLGRVIGGEFGAQAANLASSDASEVVSRCAAQLREAVLTISGNAVATLTPDIDLSDYDERLLATSGASLVQDGMSADLLTLIDESDRLCQSRARKDDGRPASPSAVVDAFLESSLCNSPARIVVQTAKVTFFGRGKHDNTATQIAAELIQGATPNSYARLLLALTMLDFAWSEESARLLPDLIRMSWASRAYHVRLDALLVAEHFGHLPDGDIRSAIVEALEELHTNNIMLSGALVEALFAYDLVAPPFGSEQVAAEIQAVLDGPPTEETYVLAQGIISSLFESALAPPYIEQYEALSEGDRTRLLVLAALAPDLSMFTDLTLSRLLTNSSPAALPAFRKWGTCLVRDTGFFQDATSCFLLGVEGSAGLQDAPPISEDATDDDDRAWACYGRILFWSCRPDCPDEEVLRLCAPLWKQLREELLRAAVDPLLRFSQTHHTPPPGRLRADHLLLTRFRPEVCHLLESYLVNEVDPSSAFRFFVKSDVDRYAITRLGQLGNADTVRTLRPYCDDLHVGSSAIEAILAIEARNGEGRERENPHRVGRNYRIDH